VPIDSPESLATARGNNKDKVVISYFTAEWCGPCKMVAPEVEKVSEGDDVCVCKVDIDKNGDIAESYNIQAVPTFVFSVGDVEAGRVQGANMRLVKELLEKCKDKTPS